jgi:hypothetical protein
MAHEMIISRHRLPQRYRISLAALWIAPVVLFGLAIFLSRGVTSAFFETPFLLFLAVMLLPAFYIWQEGIDVLSNGIIARMFWPRYYPYSALDNWYFDSRSDSHTLTIWDTNNCKIIECRAGHLTNLSSLLATLKANLRYQHWPT